MSFMITQKFSANLNNEQIIIIVMKRRLRTNTTNNAGPTNAHISPDCMDNQHLQNKQFPKIV